MTNSSSHPKTPAPKLRSRLLKFLLILVSTVLFLIGSGFLYEALSSSSARKTILHQVNWWMPEAITSTFAS